MPLTVDYLPVATSVSADVDPQSTFAGSSYQVNGFINGIAFPNQMNKVWRQASMIGACIATFISNVLQINVLDDGNLANLVSEFTQAIGVQATVGSGDLVPYSATPTFNANNFSKFEITLTGPCAPTLIGGLAFQEITVMVHQDGTGGRTFTPPGSLPMGAISTAPNATSTQKFQKDSSGLWHAVTPVMVG